MSRPFIVFGDQTDHGGVVIEASVMTDTHGKGIARVGDQVTCPKRNHGTTVIVTGDPTTISQAASATQAERARASGLISSLLPQNHQFDIHFVVRDEKTGDALPKVSYRITLEDGTSITGVTDENGLTDKISSNTKQQAKLEVHYHGDDSDGGADTHNRYDACCC
jgi:uncharacterized Zn-binding protein involved in type VI secretion